MDKDFFSKYEKLLNTVKDTYELDNIHDALIVWYAKYKLNIEPDDSIECIVNDKHAEGVDAVLIDEKNRKVYFIQAKTVCSYDNALKNYEETEIKNTLTGVEFLLYDNYKGKITPLLEEIVDQANEFLKNSEYQVEIIFLALKKPPVSSKFIDQFKTKISTDTIKVNFVGIDNLYEFYNNEYLDLLAPPPDKIAFEIKADNKYDSQISKNIPFKSVIFTCSGRDLANHYSLHREKLFQQNVRNPLGENTINDEIYKTASNSSKSNMFWYYNNGITIISKRITVSPNKTIVYLEKPQIINGAQTTHALFKALEEGTLEENIEVIVKAIETDDKMFIEKVTLYTNSQNAIRLRDLASNDDIQEKIHKIILDSYSAFYERKRGEFDSRYPNSGVIKERFGANYKEKLINNEVAAQAYLTFYLDKPVDAKRDKWKIFLKEGGFYKDIFSNNCKNLAEKIYLSWRFLRYIDKKKREYKKSYKNAENLENEQKNEIYRYDFKIHADYFILTLIRHYLSECGYKFETLEEINNVINLLNDSVDTTIDKAYDIVTDKIVVHIDEEKKKPTFYMNKYFKNEKEFILLKDRLGFNTTEILECK